MLRIGVADVGQGVALIVRQIGAERLGLPLTASRIVNEDSAQAPNAGSASASRMTYMAGRAVHDAAAAAASELSRRQGHQRHGAVPAQADDPARSHNG